MRNLQDTPSNYAALRAEIVARHSQLPKRLAQVAAFAVNHPDEIAFGTAASIAAKAEVQPSTLIRFSQALGYQGFSELQRVFRQHFREPLPDYETRLSALSGADKSSDLARLFDSFCRASERSVAQLRTHTDYDKIEAAVDVLAGARTIYLIGVRRSYPVVAYLAYALGRLGIRSVLVNAMDGFTSETIGFAEPADAVFAVSFKVYANETVVPLTRAAANGVPIVAITDSPFSPLAQNARIWFEIVEADVEGFRLLSASFALVITLAVAVAERRRKA